MISKFLYRFLLFSSFTPLLTAYAGTLNAPGNEKGQPGNTGTAFENNVVHGYTSVVYADDYTGAPSGPYPPQEDHMATKPTPAPKTVKPKRKFSFPAGASDWRPESLDTGELQSPVIDPLAQHIHAITQEIIEENKFVDVLTPETVVDLPVGIRKNITGIDYILTVDSVVITPTHAYMVSYMSLDIPQVGKLAFAGKKILFTQAGGFSGEVKLQLIEAPDIVFGDEILLKFNPERTNAVFDCQGFKYLCVSGTFIFSKNILIPENKSSTHVTASFNAPKVSNWNDLIVNVTIDPFQINGLSDFSFFVEDAVLDFSDIKNPTGLTLPDEIKACYNTESNLWRGFSLKKLTMKLPSHFKESDSPERIEIEIYDLLIDETGFTGNLTLENILSVDNGRIGNWAFSIDKLHIHILSSQFVQAGMKGEILIPIFDDGKYEKEARDSSFICYSAIINPGGNYLFSVNINNKQNIPVWKANALIYESSTVDIEVVNGEFKPKAVLNGILYIETKKATIPDIEFEELLIASDAPYISIGRIGLGTENHTNKLSGFPVQLKNVESNTNNTDNIQLDFDLVLNLVGEKDGAFGANGSFSIVGKTKTHGNLLSFTYEKTIVQKVQVNIDGGGFKLNGFIEHYDEDQTYGKGYHGKVLAEFKPGFELSAYALFGSQDNLRYWFADAMLTVESGIPVFPGLKIYGFGGGAYHHMNQTTAKVTSENSAIGKSLSTIRYIPDKDISLGIKASVNIGGPTKEAFNANTTFDIVFNNHGGLNRVTFNGVATMIAAPTPVSDKHVKDRFKKVVNNRIIEDEELTEIKKNGAINAKVFLDFDFENDCMHGDFKVYANIAGGLIKGVGENDLAGRAVMHFSGQEWYIHIGHPDKNKRVGLEFLGLTRFDSYFMIGTNIPESPSPPRMVSNILVNIDLDYMSELNKLGNGSGCAFGASLEINTGEKSFLIFYGSFNAGVGFDVMLKNYGDNIRCAGKPELIGINGWYANGQAYGYFNGDIGVKVDLPFKSGKFKILSIGAAAILQAKLPNPLWMKGTVGGRYNILGGLVKGNCAFEITIGEECEIIKNGNAVANLDIISAVTPRSNERDVDVFCAPQVIFNMPVNQEFEIKELDGVIAKYRIKLDNLQLKHEGIPLFGNLEWNENNDVVAFNSDEILPPNSNIDVFIKVSFEKKQNGKWIPVVENNQKITEEKSTSFVTGEAPDYIPESNVLYSYPIDQQYNFYSGESETGFIQLKKGQGYLFSDPEWAVCARFINDETLISELIYDFQEKKVSFKIPENLKVSKIYEVHIVSKPANTGYDIAENVKDEIHKSNLDSSRNNTLEIKKKTANENLDILQENEIYSLHFKTSHYKTFISKMNALNKHSEWIYPISTGIHQLGYTVNSYELFDEFELFGTKSISPLIQIEAQLKQNDFYNTYIYPLVYKGYPLDNKYFITSRDEKTIGIPPVNANYILQDKTGLKITSEQCLFELNNNIENTKISFVYNLMHYYNQDFTDLQVQIINDLINGCVRTRRKNRILTSTLPVIQKGYYKININYVLPGGSVISSYPIGIYNNVSFDNN